MSDLKNNKLIAEFIGMQDTTVGWFDAEGVLTQHIYNVTGGNCHDKLHFHLSWDWLIPCLAEAFEEMGGQEKYSLNHEKILDGLMELNLDKTHSSLVEFIKENNN